MSAVKLPFVAPFAVPQSAFAKEAHDSVSILKAVLVTGSSRTAYAACTSLKACGRPATSLLVPSLLLPVGTATSLSALLREWSTAWRALTALAYGCADKDLEEVVTRSLKNMAKELRIWQETHKKPEDVPALLYEFPRSIIGRQIREAVDASSRATQPASQRVRFAELASRTMTALLHMATTPQEESLWHRFRNMELEETESGVLGKRESFGKHLHFKGGVKGRIQVMQDWEWPYMYALADFGFELAIAGLPSTASTPLAVRVLEVGWGQGISGRRLMSEPERTGAAAKGISVQYEVIELHPLVAKDARAEGARHPEWSMHVHEGAWQQVIHTLSDGAYDLIFYDPYNLTPKDMGEAQHFEQWGMPAILADSLLFYRLLRPGGVLVQYAVAHRQVSASDLLRRFVAPFFGELRLARLSAPLVPEVGTSYATPAEASQLEIPAVIKMHHLSQVQ